MSTDKWEESKSKKLAAARRKLKEYQQRGLYANALATATTTTGITNAPIITASEASEVNSISSHISSNAIEKSESNVHLQQLKTNKISDNFEPEDEQLQIKIINGQHRIDNHINEVNNENPSANKDGLEQPLYNSELLTMNTLAEQEEKQMRAEGMQNVSVMQVLIAEKAQLTNTISKYQSKCQQLELTLEELRTEQHTTSARLQELQRYLNEKEQQAENIKLHNNELQQQLTEIAKTNGEHTVHISELQQQLKLKDDCLLQTTAELKEKSSSLELAQLRIQQLSDEHNSGKDDRIDSLTKTKFMYEQQIRDLQAMLQQLTQDKEHANTQYLGYVQQLNSQINQLNERNSDLLGENGKLQEHESQLIKHIQTLEKEIQKNINRKEQFKKDNENQLGGDDCNQQSQVKQLQERISSLEDEIIALKSDSQTVEFQMKSHADRAQELQINLEAKQNEIDQLNKSYEQMLAEQPNQSKLLAAMESDKIAASRALSQNLELKKQLDEMEARFVQLTNDKADLINRLDSEQYTNREMQSKYNSMEEQYHVIETRFHYKDDEMIRLSNQNEELLKNNLLLQQQIERMQDDCETIKYTKSKEMRSETEGEAETETEPEPENNTDEDHKHSAVQHLHYEQYKCRQQDPDGEQHGININDNSHHHHHHHHHDHDLHEHQDDDRAISATLPYNNPYKQNSITRKSSTATTTSTCQLATEEAVEKLQQRFTKLMSQVADLTEEKQRLEHLVLQLQGETETIGEYIALYQTQRRILKQREYEKAAETQMLQNERQQMHERLALLNRLVHSLGLQYPEETTLQQAQIQRQPSASPLQQLNDAETSSQANWNEALNANHNVVPESHTNLGSYGESRQLPVDSSDLVTSNQNNSSEQVSSDRTALNLSFNSQQSQEILNQIQSIITEIKENTKELPTIAQYQLKQNTVDHLNCCMGKFEVV